MTSKKVVQYPSGKRGRNSSFGMSVQINNRMQQVIDGTIPVESLTLEELLEGRLLSKNGDFTGRPTALIPRAFYTAVVREMRRRMEEGILDLGMEAIETIAEVMREGEGASESTTERGTTTTFKGGTQRLKAATYIVDRILGKTADRVEIDVSPWQQTVESGELLVDVEVHDLPPAVDTPAPARRGRRSIRGTD